MDLCLTQLVSVLTLSTRVRSLNSYLELCAGCLEDQFLCIGMIYKPVNQLLEVYD